MKFPRFLVLFKRTFWPVLSGADRYFCEKSIFKISSFTWGTPSLLPRFPNFCFPVFWAAEGGGCRSINTSDFARKSIPARFDSLMEVRGRIKPGLTLMRAADKISEKYWFYKIVLNRLSDPEKKKKLRITRISENNFPFTPLPPSMEIFNKGCKSFEESGRLLGEKHKYKMLKHISLWFARPWGIFHPMRASREKGNKYL